MTYIKINNICVLVIQATIKAQHTLVEYTLLVQY